jgi:hypothetical protein
MYLPTQKPPKRTDAKISAGAKQKEEAEYPLSTLLQAHLFCTLHTTYIFGHLFLAVCYYWLDLT